MSQALDARTQENLRKAHIKDGVPQSLRKVAHRHIGHLLALQSQASPDKTFLIFYDHDGARSELSYAGFLGAGASSRPLSARGFGIAARRPRGDHFA